MGRRIKQSQKRINFLTKGFELAVRYIVATNKKLEKGIQQAHAEFSKTNDEIRKAEAKLDDIAVSIIDHQKEINKNKKLMSKFEDFLN